MTYASLVRAALVAALLAACSERDPLDSATDSAGPTGDPSAGPGNMSEGTDTSTAESTTTDDTAPTGTLTDATGTTDAPTTLPMTVPATATGTTGAGLSHAVDIQPIWDANCVTSCHTPGGTSAAWFVISEDALGALVDQPALELPSMMLVAPGDPEGSYLWHKINNSHIDVGGNGTAMPPPPGSLSVGDIDTIGQWILAGCPP
ncbi:hypothetical protein [Nannocystis punicea]|uniref:Cytochrome c domain-containing protein n=1 Tax=Nannocystis punicea TaxID=2995304 RepID=A0ABY7GSH6_9BACT|nr:hypothetical protein [Nannocystis poenicansa]WAS89901.1 hypothetical protein O0S08_27220 [Nannocystis poenicansa]